jgi:hypothetical protein
MAHPPHQEQIELDDRLGQANTRIPTARQAHLGRHAAL